MSGLPWGKFFWKDWLTDPALSVCSLAAQGLWMRLLCIMSMSNPPGHLTLPPCRGNETEAKQVARMCHSDARQVRPLIEELDSRGVFDRDNAGNIMSRRMIRDAELSELGRSAAAKGWARRRGYPKGPPKGDRPNGESTGPSERDPPPESRSESDSPPRGGPRSRHHRRKVVQPESRNGFVDSATSDMEAPDHAETTHARSGRATVVPITRRVVGG
jgi:hypothetical protein